MERTAADAGPINGQAGDEQGIRLNTADGTIVTCSRLPSAMGDAVGIEPLRHQVGNAATGGIWRVQGTAGSAILKVAKPPSATRSETAAWPTSDEPTHWNYWRRELLAYETGLAAAAYASGGITAPALLATNTRADGSVELWLADVSGTGGFGWPVQRLARFAYELGAGQARWAGRVPDTPWLSRDWLAQYLAGWPSRSVTLRAADWDHRSLAVWPPAVRRRLARLWAERHRVLAAARAAERTLCHLDVWPANLVEDAGTSVLLDWTFTGEGAIGEDVANLILDSCTDGLMDIALLPEIAASATDGYLAGLRDGGWTGSDDDVRFAIATCGAAKYSWFGPAFASRAVKDDLGRSSYGQDSSAASAVQRLATLVELIAEWSVPVLGTADGGAA